MAIVSVRRLFTGRGGSRNFAGTMSFHDVWEVVTDDQAATEQDVAGPGAVDPDTAVKVPGHGESHPTFPDSLVTDVDPEQSDESFFIWYVSVKYESNPSAPGAQEPANSGAIDGVSGGTGDGDRPGTYPTNPLEQRPVWAFGSVFTDEVCNEWLPVDQAGNVTFTVAPVWVTLTTYGIGTYVQNGNNVYVCILGGTSAGGPGGFGQNILDGTVRWRFFATVAQTLNDPRFAILVPCYHSGHLPFDPPAMVEVSRSTFTVTKNMPQYTLEYHMLMTNAVNWLVWRGVPPRCAKCNSVKANYEFQNNVSYIPVTWEFSLNPDTWDVRLLDQGYGSYSLISVPDPADPTKRILKNEFHRFKDAAGDDVGSAVPMDGKGKRLEPLADPVYLRGIPRRMKVVDFNSVLPW